MNNIHSYRTAQPHYYRGLTADRSRTRVDIARRSRVVQLEQDAGVRRLVRARKRDQAASLERPCPTSHGDLCASNVQLCTAHCSRTMQRDVLRTEEVVAVCDALGDRNADLCLAYPNNHPGQLHSKSTRCKQTYR